MQHLKGAVGDREYEARSYKLACMSREAPRFFFRASKFFDNSIAYSFVFTVWECDQICLSI